MNMFDVHVSKIHGLGCFAGFNIQKGWERPIYSRCVEEELAYDPHVIYTDDGPRKLKAPFCYINHSDNPNAEIYSKDGQLFLHFLKPVHRGEEVTINYASE